MEEKPREWMVKAGLATVPMLGEVGEDEGRPRSGGHHWTALNTYFLIFSFCVLSYVRGGSKDHCT